MSQKKISFQIVFLTAGLLLPSLSRSSFIETTMGTAVVNDATASYFNPAALTLLKNSQIIPLATVAQFQTRFTGQSTNITNAFTQSGTSNSTSNYYSPSCYIGVPFNEKVTMGFAAVSNFAYRSPEENSILRYTQASNTIQDYDLVPALGIKINDYFALGAGINFSYTNFDLHPIMGFPGSNTADSQGENQSDGSGIGGNIGFLLRPRSGTFVGFDYRSMTTYKESGKSIVNGTPHIVSNDYHFTMRTPPRSILSVSQMITSTFGMITTIQRIQWGVITNIHISGVATLFGTTPVIVNTNVPYYLHNTWAFTVGGNYRFKPDWIMRAAGTYNQSPGNGAYQMTTGDSYILGLSLGHEINKTLNLDGSYAHAFIQDKSIHMNGNRYKIVGNNQASRDVVSLKVTLNV